jgi:hypothetical protein
MFENGLMKGIFGTNRRNRRRVSNLTHEKLHNLNSIPNTSVIKAFKPWDVLHALRKVRNNKNK